MFVPDLPPVLSEFRLSALSRWDNEGGAVAVAAHEAQKGLQDMTNAELVLLRVRVITKTC